MRIEGLSVGQVVAGLIVLAIGAVALTITVACCVLIWRLLT